MHEGKTTFRFSLNEFLEWLDEVFSRKPKMDLSERPPRITNPWAGQYAQTLFPNPPQQNLQTQSEQLGAVKTSVQSTAQTAVDMTAKNPAFAKIAALLTFLSDAIATIAETMQKNSAEFNAVAQIYARSGLRMG